MDSFVLTNPNLSAPLLPVLVVSQVAQSAKAKVAWPESPGAFQYRVQYGTTTEDYDTEVIVEASSGLCEHTTADYPDGVTVYFVVSAIGANGVEGELSDEGSVTIDAYSILEIAFSIDAPVAGENCADASIPPTADYTFESADWEDADATPLETGQPFVAGTKYVALVVLQAKEGHVFDAAVEVAVPEGVDDAIIAFNAARTEVSITCNFLALTTDALTFTLAAPVKEANAANAAVDAGAAYEVTSTAWHDAADAPLAVGQPFVAETVYHAVVVITAKENKRLAKPFADLGITLPATSALVAQSVDTTEEQNAITIEISFPATAA